MDQETFNHAIEHIRLTVPGVWPNDYRPFDTKVRVDAPGYTDGFPSDKKEWDAYQYNPPEYMKFDPPLTRDTRPEVRPKPTWDELVEAGRIGTLKNEIWLKRNWTEPEWRKTRLVRAKLTDAEFLRVGAATVHIGSGLDHMTGLLQMVEQANVAGETLPHVVMRDGNHVPVSWWTVRRVREVLAAAARRENVVESAHNAIAKIYNDLVATRDDETKKLEERAAAAERAWRYAEDYETHLAAAIKAYDPDALPADLATFKEMLTERLEAAATGRQKELKGAASQQAIDNWATCVDQDNALSEIALACAGGVLAIARSEDQSWRKAAAWEKVAGLASHTHKGVGDPKATLGAAGDTYVDTESGRREAVAAFDEAVAKIGAVDVLRVPVWKIGAKVHTGSRPSVAVKGRKVEVRAEQPTGTPAVPGPVAITGWGTRYADGTKGSASVRAIKDLQRPETHCAEITVPAGETKPVTVEIRAANICGPAMLTVVLTP